MHDTLKKIWRHGLTYTAGALAGKVAAFFLLPLYLHYMQPAEYGVLQMLIVTTELTAILLSMGLSSAMIRYWNKYDAPEKKHSVVSTALGFSLLLSGGGIVLALVASPWLSDAVLGGREYLFALQLMFCATFLEINLLLPLDLLRATERSKAFVKISLLRSIANMLLTIYLIAGLGLGVLGAMWANVIIGFLAAFLLISYTIGQVGSPRISINLLRPMLAYGLPFIPAGLALYLLHSASRFFLRAYEGLEAVGIFGLGFTIAFLVSQLVTAPFTQVWGWLMFDVAKTADAARTIARVGTYFFAAATFFALILSSLSRDLLMVVGDPAYWDAYLVVPLIALGYIFYGSEWVASTGFFVSEKTSHRAYILLSAALLNLALNTILVPAFGVQGAAVAGAVSFLAMLAASMHFSNRIFYVPWEVGRCLHALLAAIVLCLFALFTVRIYPNIWPGFVVRALIALSFPAVLFASGFLLPEEARKIKRRRSRAPSASREKRLLIISHHFPPDMQVASQRPAKFAKYLPAAGWQVWVLTLPAEYHPVIDHEADLDFMPQERIIRVAPWRKSKSPAGDDAVAMATRPSLLKGVKAWLAASIGMRLNEIMWVPPAIKAAREIVEKEEIDVIFSSCFPFSCHLIARAVSNRTGCPWVADFHDPWADNPYIFGQRFWQRALRRWLQRRTISHADKVVIVNAFMREYFLEHAAYLDASRVVAIDHSFDPDDFHAALSVKVPANDSRMVITYTGSLTSYRSPESLLDGLAAALAAGHIEQTQIELRFMGLDDMGDGPNLAEMVRARALDSVVRALGTVPHKEALAHQLASDVLVYLQTQKGGHNIFASAKLYEYLATGRPILAICEESMATKLLRAAGGGIIVEPDKVKEIADSITALHTAWSENRLPAQTRQKVVESLMEPAPTKALAALLDALLNVSGDK